MKLPNTKKHWTALALARYYDKFQKAARARDLFPYMREIHGGGESIAHSLRDLAEDGTIDYAEVKAPRQNGGTTTVHAYYPTPITIEDLRDLEEPTEMPDGSPIPDGLSTELSTARVSAEDDIDKILPEPDESVGMDYAHKYPQESSGYLPDDDEDDIEQTEDDDSDDDEPSFTCSYCGRGIGGKGPLTMHERACLNDIHEQALEERAQPDEPTFETEQVDITPDTTADPIGDIGPEPTEGSTVTAGSLRGKTDWNRIATRLERKAMDADDAGLTEMAAAYSQFAVRAVEGDLDIQTAYTLLGDPVLEIEEQAATQTTG